MSIRVDISEIYNSLKLYQSVSLKDMQNAALMDRVDTKFVASVDLIPNILKELADDYKVLEIDGERAFLYKTNYFDTKGYDMYEAHQNGKLNRYKVRQREYVSSGLHFLEVKFKNNKRRTIKKRIERKEDSVLSHPELHFLNENTPYNSEELELKLSNCFHRITLVGNHERVTIDFGLSFSDNNGFAEDFHQIAIVELKQLKYSSTTKAMNALRKNKVKAQSFSKYCLGAASFNSQIKSNRMKSKFELIHKIESTFGE
ncbi:polyphosphate polymerase domain-containing protein [Carboxylicivirga marina]|uniref:polyphosphate polymerase domain-containing protein n=1 Tax=Carboxylicivirga marina TaxID=2800988 RepID=UPI002593CBD7|nr:polyphosphate polymerase domain-containing protein [uncultured Carboxylicivirga sp.]